MSWNHQSMYDSLLKKGHYEKPGEKDKYVSLDHHERNELNSVLYRPDTKNYSKWPLHINDSRAGFSKELFNRIYPALEASGTSSNGWKRYRVIDWGKFAEGLGLS